MRAKAAFQWIRRKPRSRTHSPWDMLFRAVTRSTEALCSAGAGWGRPDVLAAGFTKGVQHRIVNNVLAHAERAAGDCRNPDRPARPVLFNPDDTRPAALIHRGRMRLRLGQSRVPARLSSSVS